MSNGESNVLETSGQPPAKTFGSGGVIGLVGLWAYQGFHVLMETVAPGLVEANPGFLETSANLVAAIFGGGGRLLYAWIKRKFG